MKTYCTYCEQELGEVRVVVNHHNHLAGEFCDMLCYEAEVVERLPELQMARLRNADQESVSGWDGRWRMLLAPRWAA